MVKCKICIEEKGESKDFEHLHFHVLKKHGMTSQDYRNQFPDAPITSSKFRQKQRKQMLERRKNIPDLEEKLHRWRNEKPESMDSKVEPTMDNIESLTERVQYLKLLLGSGVRGEKYKRAYHEYMEIKMLLEHLIDLYIKQS